MDRITQNTHIEKIITQYPSLSRVFIQFGLPCLICGEPFWGTVEELSRQHGVNIDDLVNKLNEKRREIDDKL